MNPQTLRTAHSPERKYDIRSTLQYKTCAPIWILFTLFVIPHSVVQRISARLPHLRRRDAACCVSLSASAKKRSAFALRFFELNNLLRPTAFRAQFVCRCSLRCSQTRRQHTERRARNVVQPNLVAELH